IWTFDRNAEPRMRCDVHPLWPQVDAPRGRRQNLPAHAQGWAGEAILDDSLFDGHADMPAAAHVERRGDAVRSASLRLPTARQAGLHQRPPVVRHRPSVDGRCQLGLGLGTKEETSSAWISMRSWSAWGRWAAPRFITCADAASACSVSKPSGPATARARRTVN